MRSQLSGFASLSLALAIWAMVQGHPVLAAAHEGEGNGIEGTWRMQVTPYICGTDVTLPAFSALTTYAHGGTLTGTGNAPHFQPGQRTPEFGVWTHSGSHSYRSVREAFILFPSATVLARGTQRVEENILVRNDTFRSEAYSRLIDHSGNIVMAGCARIVGERMQ